MGTLVGKKAPSFTAPAIVNGGQLEDKFSLDQYIGNSYVVLFFYPKDFTFVCPTELQDLAHTYEDIKAEGGEVLSVSTDTHFVHM